MTFIVDVWSCEANTDPMELYMYDQEYNLGTIYFSIFKHDPVLKHHIRMNSAFLSLHYSITLTSCRLSTMYACVYHELTVVLFPWLGGSCHAL